MAYSLDEKRALVAYHALPQGSEFRLSESDFDDLLRRAGGNMPNLDGSPTENTSTPDPAPVSVDVVQPQRVERVATKTAVVDAPTFKTQPVEDRDTVTNFRLWVAKTVPEMATRLARSLFEQELRAWIDRGIGWPIFLEANNKWNETRDAIEDAKREREHEAHVQRVLDELEEARRIADRLSGSIKTVERTKEEVEAQRAADRAALERSMQELERLKQAKAEAEAAALEKIKQLEGEKAELSDDLKSRIQALQESSTETAASLRAKIEEWSQIADGANVALAQLERQKNDLLEKVKTQDQTIQQLTTQAQQLEEQRRAAEQAAQLEAERAAEFQRQVERNKAGFRDWIKSTMIDRFILRFENGESETDLKADFWKLFDLRHWNDTEIQPLWELARDPGRVKRAEAEAAEEKRQAELKHQAQQETDQELKNKRNLAYGILTLFLALGGR